MNDAEIEDSLPCAGKLAFDSEKQALGAAVTAEYRHGSKVRPYNCQHCGLWHLSTDYDT